jgi:hypothetical protein
MLEKIKVGAILGTIVFVPAYLFYQSGYFGRKVASVTGYSESCISGVKYIQFASGATVMYTPDGKIATCSK